MSTTAEIMAIGGFRKEIADCLEYPADRYDNVQEGRVVFASLFYCATRSQAVQLADCFGAVLDDFNTHMLSPQRLTAAARAELAVDWPGDLDKFDRLLAAGFKMIYRPDF